MAILNNARDLYIGSLPVSKVYKGSHVVWENGIPVIWNQLFNYDAILQDVSSPSINETSITLTKRDAYSSQLRHSISIKDGALKSGHKYLFATKIITDGSYYQIVFNNIGDTTYRSDIDSSSITTFINPSGTGNLNLFISFYEKESTDNTITIVRPIIVDLTLMFGDGNEPVDILDDKIAWIKDYADSNPLYDSGRNVHMKYNNAIIWNQLNDNSFISGLNNGIYYKNNNDGSWTLSGSKTTLSSQSFRNLNYVANKYNFEDGHKFLISGGSELIRIQFATLNNPSIIATQGGDAIIYEYNMRNGDNANYIRLQIPPEIDLAETTTIIPLIFDLTLMFGDGNEPTDITDKRVEWILNYAVEHREFNSGEAIIMK